MRLYYGWFCYIYVPFELVCDRHCTAGNMLESKTEPRVNIKFPAKLKKTAAQLFRMKFMAKSAYHELAFSNGINGFVVGEVEDDDRL